MDKASCMRVLWRKKVGKKGKKKKKYSHALFCERVIRRVLYYKSSRCRQFFNAFVVFFAAD